MNYVVRFLDNNNVSRSTEIFSTLESAQFAEKIIKLVSSNVEINTIPNGPFLGDAFCGLCQHKWNTLLPSGLKVNEIECPQCHKMIPADLALK